MAGGNQIERVITDTSTLQEAPWVRFVVLVALSYEGMPGVFGTARTTAPSGYLR